MNKRRVEAIGWQVLRDGCDVERRIAGARTGSHSFVSQHGSGRAIPDARSKCGDCVGAQCGSGFHFARCHGAGSGAAWVHHRGEREERLCVRGRTGLDVSLQCTAVLESEDAGSDLFQSGGRALDFAIDVEEVGPGAERTFKRSSDGRHPSCAECEGTSNVRTRGDELHDVEARVPGRWRRPLGFASDVLCPADETFDLGCGFAGISGIVEPAISGCS